MYKRASKLLDKVGPYTSEFETLTRPNVDNLFAVRDTLVALGNIAESGRDERTGQVTVSSYRWDDLNNPTKLEGQIKGSKGDNYSPRISLSPKRGFWCDCRDSQSKGVKVGPCKHVLALRKKALEEEIQPRVDTIENALEVLLENYAKIADAASLA
jgi:hypothetical protein